MKLFYKKDETVFERVTNATALGLGAAFAGGALHSGAIMVILFGLVFYLSSQAYLTRLKVSYQGLPRWSYSIPFIYLVIYFFSFVAMTWVYELRVNEQQSDRSSHNAETRHAINVATGDPLSPDCKDLMQRFPHTAPFMKGCEHLRQPSVAPEPLRVSE